MVVLVVFLDNAVVVHTAVLGTVVLAVVVLAVVEIAVVVHEVFVIPCIDVVVEVVVIVADLGLESFAGSS